MFNKNYHIKSNNVATVDYKRPVQTGTDMRTSYHFGHRLIYDNDVHIARKKGGVEMVLKKRPFQPQLKSEMKASYTPKYPQPEAKYTALNVAKIQCIKGFDEGTLKFAPRPIHGHITTYNNDYTEKSPAPQPLPLLTKLDTGSKVKPATFSVSPEEPSYSKYLDMMATSYTLDYGPFSKEQLSTLASRDNITLWTWNDVIKSNVAKEVHPTHISTFPDSKNVIPSRTAIKSRSVPKLVSFVPNSGLVSEFRRNYGHPDDCLKIEVDLQQPLHMVEPLRFTPPTTEYSLIGSGDRIQRYV